MLTKVLFAATFTLFLSGSFCDALAQTQTNRTDTIDAALKESSGAAGRWVGELTTAYGSARIILHLKQGDGEKVQGTYDAVGSAGMFFDRPVVGNFRDGKLSLLRPDVAFTGIEATISGDEMEGSFYGKNGFQKLRAKRVAEKK